MRIGLITSEYVTENYFEGGLANYLFRIALVLKDMGHEPIVIVASDRSEELKSDGIRIIRVKKCNWLNNVFNFLSFNYFKKAIDWLIWSLTFKLALKKIHQKTPFDIVQYPSYQGPAFFRYSHIPSVVRLSSYNPFWREFDNIKSTAAEAISDWIERIAIKKVDGVFGPGKLIAQKVEQISGRDVEIIESPYIETVEKADNGVYQDLLEGREYLLFFGRLNPLKGILDISQVIEQVLRDNPKLFFVFVGKDMSYQGQPLMNLLWNSAGSYRGRVIYLGSLRHNQLKPIIENALAVVLPSRIDNFPNTCIEAMACSRVVVGTFEGGFRQLITNELNGFLCHRDNPEELLEAIKKVIRLSKKDLQKIGKEAKKRIELLTPDNVGYKVVEYYEKIIAAFKG